jgi:hypothetical protein
LVPLALIPLIDFFPQLNGIFPEFLFLEGSLKFLLEMFMRAMRGMRE